MGDVADSRRLVANLALDGQGALVADLLKRLHEPANVHLALTERDLFPPLARHLRAPGVLDVNAPDVWPDEDRTYLPHYEAESATADKAAYPFYLNVFRPEVFAGGGRAHQPWLQEIAGPHVHMVWQPWAEINPHTARQLGLSDGDWIWVESPAGRLRVKAKLYPGVMPDVINIPYGLGHDASDRVDRGRAANALQLVHAPADRISGLPSLFATRVRIYKDSGPPEAQRLPSAAGLEPGRGRDPGGGMVMEKRYG